MAKFTAQFETRWNMSNLPGDYLEQKLRNVVGFKLIARRAEAKVKMGQRQSPEGRELVSSALSKSADPAARDVARLMKRVIDQKRGPTGGEN